MLYLLYADFQQPPVSKVVCAKFSKINFLNTYLLKTSSCVYYFHQLKAILTFLLSFDNILP